MVAARYTVFSNREIKYVNNIHTHCRMIPNCSYCKRRIYSRPVKGCKLQKGLNQTIYTTVKPKND
nr:unnamed protein product [Callosobruchus analis]